MTDELVHPLTGELLSTNDVPQLRRALETTDHHLGSVYRARRRILEHIGETETYLVPRPARQSDVQQRVARCPRCQARLEEVA